MSAFTRARAEQVADSITGEVGEQMGELFAALPDLIHDHAEEYAGMSQADRVASVQAVAEVFGGVGYVYGYPVR